MPHDRKPAEAGSPDQRAFHRFLEWLDEGVDSGGQRYLDLRRRLTSYFDRKNCPSPDDLADETLKRVARRLEEEGGIVDTSPARYCYIVARFVFLEFQRRAQPAPVILDELPGRSLRADEAEERRQKLLDCLEGCVGRLETSQRDLILGYYLGERRTKIENRRRLAAKFGLSVNAMSIRACRIRNRLEACVRSCLGEQGGDLFL